MLKEKANPSRIKSESCDILLLMQTSQIVTKTCNLCELSAAMSFSFHSFPVIFNVFHLLKELVGNFL